MNTYIGSRTVTAKPMTQFSFAKYLGSKKVFNTEEDVRGFMYEDIKGISNHKDHKGQLSWMPTLNFTTEFLDLGHIQDHSPHVQRLLGELAQLEQKLSALKVFLKSPVFLKLTFTERDLLQEQSRIMTRYIAILEERIAS